jgi:transcriptional regulator with XRE-family HTH domain
MGDVIRLRDHATSRLKPKTRRSKRISRLAHSAEKIRKYSAGMAPLAFQLLTAEAPTPASSAAAAEPPSALTSSSTERSMPIVNSRCMKRSSGLSTIHDLEVENSLRVKFVLCVGTSRDEIIARLRLLPAILGKSDAELARACGVSPSTWSNYKSATASKNTIIWEAALELWNAYGIPMEWTYDGQAARIADPNLREKLALAHRLAETQRAAKHLRRHLQRR